VLGPYLLPPVGGATTNDTAPPGHSIADYLRGYEVGQGLRGFRSSCGLVTATWGLVCPRCGKADLAEVRLSGRGKIVAFTVQHVPGDEFVNDAPYAYVVVELEEGGRITGWMPTVRDEDSLKMGDSVHWVAGYKPGVQFAKDSDGAQSP
jgi:uncharacterized OB-fold protein